MSCRSRRLKAAALPVTGRRRGGARRADLLMMRRLLILGLAFGGLVFCAGPASAASLRWSGPHQVDFTGAISLGAIICPASDQCDALDAVGRLEQFNPEQFEPNLEASDLETSTVTLQAPAPLVTMACPTAGSVAPGAATDVCTVIDRDGGEATFGLDNFGSYHYVRVDRAGSVARGVQPTSVACPSRTRCVLTDSAGGLVSFSPQDPSAASRTVLTRGETGGLVAVTCPSSTQCTAIGQTQEWTFNPADPSASTTAAIDTAPGAATALTCPSSTQCTAVDASGRETTFDPETTAAATPVVVSTAAHADLTAVLCPSTTLCTGADSDGYLESFDPQTGALVSRFAGQDVNDMICLSATLCLADQSNGGVLPFLPGSSQPPPAGSNGPATEASLDNGSPVVSVTCPATTRCVGADASGALIFDPYPGYRGGGEYRLPGSGSITGLACASFTLCSAVRGDEQVSFNPHHIKHLHPAVADHDGDATFTAVRCRGIQCVAIDSDGVAVTYDPANGHIVQGHIDVEAGRTLTALACPSRSQCTATDDDGAAISFDPLTGHRLLRVTIDRKVGLDTASDVAGHELDGIACPDTTSCVAVDTLGYAVHFNPRSRHGAEVRRADAIEGLTAVACPTGGRCVLTGADGRVFTGAPRSSRWTARRPFQATGLTAVTCVTTGECVAGDTAGEAFTSRPS